MEAEIGKKKEILDREDNIELKKVKVLE